jgi:hypothetical protein
MAARLTSAAVISMKTSVNFSDENPSVHLLRALVRRIRYLRGLKTAARGRAAGSDPKTSCEAFHYALTLHAAAAGRRGSADAR